MEWRNKYDSTESFETEPGSPLEPVYTPIINKETGAIDLEQTGVKNLYDEIQSHAESVDIDKIIERYMMTGDESILNKRIGSYIDVSDMPRNYTELLQRLVVAEREFDSMPEDIRRNYNSIEEYVNDIGSPKWIALHTKEESKKESEGGKLDE